MSLENRLATPADVHRLHVSFSATTHGEHLASRVRYDSYRPSHVTNAEWVTLLGADVSNLDHMPLTAQLTDTFVRLAKVCPTYSPDNQFSSEDASDLRLAAYTHDWGEGIVGHEDITYRDKTEDDDVREHQAVNGILRANAFNQAATDNEADRISQRLADIQVNIVHNRETRLGRAFNAIERMGYLRTAVRAWRVQDRVEDPEVQGSLQWLTADVLTHQTQPLLHYVQSYFPVAQMLESYTPVISEAFHTLQGKVFERYGGEKVALQKEKFLTAKQQWETAQR